MKQVVFDFERIGSIEDFYTIARPELGLPDDFGNNLDALWDSVTGYIELPVEIRFINMSMSQLETFDTLIELFEEAAEALTDNLSFEYYLKPVI